MSSDGKTPRSIAGIHNTNNSKSRIPKPKGFRRSFSLREPDEHRWSKSSVDGPAFNSVDTSRSNSRIEHNGYRNNVKRRQSCSELFSSPYAASPDKDDCDSLKSGGSACSTFSLDAYMSGRSHSHSSRCTKNTLHCQTKYETNEEYLTPTQRQTREIRQLKAILMRTKRELEGKTAEVLLLTKELDNLRSSPSPEKMSATPGMEEKMQLSVGSSKSCDSGHFEQPDFMDRLVKDSSVDNDMVDVSRKAAMLSSVDEQNFTNATVDQMYQRQLEEMKRYHTEEYQEMKEKYNDKVENLLQKLNEANMRYFDLRPQLDRANDRIRKLESQVRILEDERIEQEQRHHQMYLKMYKKGQEAARFEHADEVIEFAHQAPNRVAVPELLQQLRITENELERMKNLYRREIYKKVDGVKDTETTLHFLKDAVYYFLTDKDNRGHLQAIESILGFTDMERMNVERSLLTRSKLLK